MLIQSIRSSLLGAVVARRVFRFGALLGVAAGVLGFGAAAYADDAAQHQSWLTRPFELGVSGSSIEHIIDFPFIYCYTGTLGSLVTDGTDDYILSNNHILAKENDPDNQLDPDGYDIIQPGLLDEGPCTQDLGEPANIVAYLTDYVEILFGKGKNPPENWVDAAIAITNVSTGYIKDVGMLTGPPVPVTPELVGDLVQKSGRTTGQTFGEVVATDVKIKVRYQSGTALFLDQIEVVGLCDTNFSAGGDSGSLIVTLRDGDTRAAVGLLFAGGGASTFANPIQTVLDDLRAEAGLTTLSMVHDGAGDVDDVTGNAAVLPSCSGGGGSVTADDDSYNLPKKQTVLIVAGPGVLENDSGFVGGPSLVSGSGPTRGTLKAGFIGGDGGFTYTLGEGQERSGSDSFVYEISDGTNFAPATVTINLASKGGGRPRGAGSASFGLEHALQVRADHEDELFEIPGVLGTGIGADASGNPVIRIYVENAARSVDHPIPADIEGLPVRIVVTGTIEAY